MSKTAEEWADAFYCHGDYCGASPRRPCSCVETAREVIAAAMAEAVREQHQELVRLREEQAQFRPDFGKSTAPAHVFIQWQGTTVCGDFRCKCGASAHLCGEQYMFYVKCGGCGQIYEVPHTVPLRPQPASEVTSPCVVEAKPDAKEGT